MSLILCRQERVEHPFPVEDLGIHIHSSQELCYVIYHHPLMVMEKFVDDSLLEFLRSELRMPFLAERLEKWLESRGESDELLFLILQDCGFYSPQEQSRYRQEVTALRKLSPLEYARARADYFYRLGLYGKAVAMYEKVLEPGKDMVPNQDLKSRVWNNIAACYTKLFCYQKAMHAYDCAYNEKANPEYLKRMFFLTCLKPEIEMKDRYREMITMENRSEWIKEVQKVLEEVELKEPVVDMHRMFSLDPEKRIDGAADVLNRWKVEYRRMI